MTASLWEWVAGLLSAVAIGFAVIQFLDSRALKFQMRSALDTMNNVLKSVSHRFIGKFPNNMPEINRLTQEATHYLFVLTDWVGYGSYSEPVYYNKYEAALIDLRGRSVPVRVCVIAYSKRCLREHFENQISPGDFDKEKRSEKFSSYYALHRARVTPPQTYDE